MNHKIKAGWMKWRRVSKVLCDCRILIKLKGKFYKTIIQSTMLYGFECWAIDLRSNIFIK